MLEIYLRIRLQNLLLVKILEPCSRVTLLFCLFTQYPTSPPMCIADLPVAFEPEWSSQVGIVCN